jgi:hypothetical protein
MFVQYDLSRIPALAGLELAIENRAGGLLVHAQGPPAPVVAPYLQNYLDWMSSRGPSAAIAAPISIPCTCRRSQAFPMPGWLKAS